MANELSNPIFQDAEKAREWLEAHLWPDGTLMVSRAGQAFDANGELVDQKVRDQLAAFVQGFAAFAAATRR